MTDPKVYYKLQFFWHQPATKAPASLSGSGSGREAAKRTRVPTQSMKEFVADPTKPLRPERKPHRTLNQCEEVEAHWLAVNTKLPAGPRRNDRGIRKCESRWLVGTYSEQHQRQFVEFVGEGARVQLVEIERPGVIAAWVFTKGAWVREMPEWKQVLLAAPRKARGPKPKTRLLQNTP